MSTSAKQLYIKQPVAFLNNCVSSHNHADFIYLHGWPYTHLDQTLKKIGDFVSAVSGIG